MMNRGKKEEKIARSLMIDINGECFVKNAIMKAIWWKNANFYQKIATFIKDKTIKPMIVHWKSWEGSMLGKIYLSMWYNLKCQSNRYKHEKNYWQLYNNYNYDNQKREGQGWCDNRQERNQGWQNNQRYQQDRNVQSN